MIVLSQFLFRDPGSRGQFMMVHMKRIIAIQLRKETQQQASIHAPGLGSIVTDVSDMDAYFFHHLAFAGLFGRFADLAETGDQGIIAIDASGILADKQFIPVGDRYDDGWRDPRG